MRQDKTFYLKLILLVLIAALLLVFRSEFGSLDLTIASKLTPNFRQNVPDSNLILITISEKDIDGLGGYPLKRSYYALLIKTLKRYQVKTIGIEVLFAKAGIEINYYDQLLQQEIQNAGNVVLASFAPENSADGMNITADSIILPAFTGAESGHLNYFEHASPMIPEFIRKGNILYPSFAGAVTGKKFPEPELKVNFYSEFSSFRQIALLDFFNYDTASPDSLVFLRGKIVLIGVTDQKFTAKVHSFNEGNLPGLALHAFAADNLLSGYQLQTGFYIILILLTGVSLFAIQFIAKTISYSRLSAYYAGGFAATAIIFILLFTAGVVVPFTALIIYTLTFSGVDLYNTLLNKGLTLAATRNESESLRLLLEKKTAELHSLEQQVATAKINETAEVNTTVQSLKQEIEKLRSSVRDEETHQPDADGKSFSAFEGLIYRSGSMKQVINYIKKFAPANENVLIIGESGTGKELTAKAIHTLSARCTKPFLAVNCGALSESLLESELFGHVKGAFTGAATDKEGRFETADSGTIFLDEIGEISENFQLKLLRVLQEGTLERVGSSKTIKVDVRVVAATNKNLEKAVREGKFREDLYYRLNILKISLPPLRDRKDDIPPLVMNFIKNGDPAMQISVAAIEALSAHEWKGNIRELESVIKRALVFAKGENKSVITLADLPSELTKNISVNYEDVVLQSLRDKKFNHSSFTDTARELGTGRTLINEHFRGAVLKTLSEHEYDILKAASLVAATNEAEVVEKVSGKISTILQNISDDASLYKGTDFESVKSKLIAKYRNLPKKFHEYLDEAIRRYI